MIDELEACQERWIAVDMNQGLDAILHRAWTDSGRVRIAILRAVGRSPNDWPPSDDVLIAELEHLANAIEEYFDAQLQAEIRGTAIETPRGIIGNVNGR
jgi:hypothetical protein